jgi:hypothetical protein
MKKSKIVVGASIACLCIAIAIQAVFGGGMGLRAKKGTARCYTYKKWD